jgi:hypothetical protein
MSYDPRKAAPAPPPYLSYGRGRGFDQTRGRGFDAAGASGFAFLQSMLEKLDTNLVEPLQAVTHPRDIKVNIGGGWPEFISTFASNYATTGSKYFGLQANRNTETPETQADIQKALWNTYIWAQSMTMSYVDLQRFEQAQRSGLPAPYSLQKLYDQAIDSNWNKALDYVVYWGFNGDPGLVNNTNAPSTALTTAAAGGTTWAAKTPQEKLNDVNLLITTILTNSGVDMQRAMPDSMLVPLTQYALLSNPFTLAGIGSFDSIKSYIERNCLAAMQGRKFEIKPLPNDWLASQGAGAPATTRCIVYRNDEDCLYLDVPQPKVQTMTVPVLEGAGAWKTAFGGCMSQVIFKRTTTMCYGDGI